MCSPQLNILFHNEKPTVSTRHHVGDLLDVPQLLVTESVTEMQDGIMIIFTLIILTYDEHIIYWTLGEIVS